MATYRYLILQNSDLSTVKRFKAIGLRTPKERTDNFNITLSGKLDKAAGVIIDTFQYVLRVPAEVDDIAYGTYDDLLELFELNNPNGTPSDVLTLTDHLGDTHTVKFNENIVPEPLTTQLEGPNAWYIISISLMKIVSTGGSGS